MATHLLVVTPSPSFGELIRRSLEETKEYRVFIVNSKASAIVRADEESCRMAFLDLDMGEQWVEEVGRSLRTVIPDIKLFVLVQNETPPALDAIRPWTLVHKPFELPELLRALDRPQETLQPVKKENIQSSLPWIQDVSKAAQHLTRLTLESSAQAALITQDNELWAYAGQLTQDAAQEVTRALARNWNGQRGSDLLRFIRLENTRAEHMLFATELAEGMLLAMVFDAETPFSTIRSQAGQLASSLGSNEITEEKIERTAWPKNSKPDPAPALHDEIPDEDEIDVPRISEILTDIPAPRAEPKSSPLKGGSSGSSAEYQRPADPDQTRRSIFSRESSPPIPLNNLPVTDQQSLKGSRSPSTLDDLEVTAPSKFQPRPETPIRRQLVGELDETRRQATEEFSGGVVLEPASAGVYHLPYACLLLPRFASHYLTGDIADQLSEWLPNICIAFGWRLEYLAVRPEYLQWVVNVPPATAPGYLMRIMRQQTSEKIFVEFMRLKKDNPSGDFWAPGYLIMGGTQPHPSQLVKDYIQQIRQRQGIEKRRR